MMRNFLYKISNDVFFFFSDSGLGLVPNVTDFVPFVPPNSTQTNMTVSYPPAATYTVIVTSNTTVTVALSTSQSIGYGLIIAIACAAVLGKISQL